MSEAALHRVVAALAHAGAVLGPSGQGYAVFPQGDRRRRPLARASGSLVRMLVAEGALAAVGDGFRLSEAGQASVRRRAATPAIGAHDVAFVAQHAAISAGFVMELGRVRAVSRVEGGAGLTRLAALTDASGGPWFSSGELAAARRLREDWERGQAGLTRGSDWTAPPRGKASHGPGRGPEGVAAAAIDARRRLAQALERLAAPLARLVERVCLEDEGLEAVERSSGWPPRSAKVALKLALAQLASSP